MSSRDPRLDSGSGSSEHLSDILPIDRSAIESISWDLGTRITDGAETPRLLTLQNQSTRSSISVFDATDNTCIVRFRTPVGREKFFGVAAADLRQMLPDLLERGDWSLTRGAIEAI